MSTKLLLEKSAKTKESKNKKTKKHLKSWTDFGDKTGCSGRFLRPHFQNSFPQTFYISIVNSKMSRSMCNLRHKVRNGQNLPHESPNFTNYFFICNFSDNYFIFPQT